jgi:hypothetical protein
MSIKQFGTVDIDGLWLLRQIQGDHGEYRYAGFKERKDVMNVIEPFYHHIPGTEYLAANPIVIPKLTELIESCPRASSNVVFDQLAVSTSARDPF